VRRLPTGHNVQEEDPDALAAIVTEVTDAAQRIVSGGT
jgi:hypothetical protein